MFDKAALAAAAVFAFAADPADAQSPPAAPDAGEMRGEIADITITATRMESSLQSTPIAVTATTAAELSIRSISSTAEMAAIVPNATFRESQGAYGPGVSAFIRGI